MWTATVSPKNNCTPHALRAGGPWRPATRHKKIIQYCAAVHCAKCHTLVHHQTDHALHAVPCLDRCLLCCSGLLCTGLVHHHD